MHYWDVVKITKGIIKLVTVALAYTINIPSPLNHTRFSLDAFLIWCICSLQQHVGLLLLHTIICRMTYSSTSCIIDENNSLVRIDNIVLNILYINIGKCYTPYNLNEHF